MKRGRKVNILILMMERGRRRAFLTTIFPPDVNMSPWEDAFQHLMTNELSESESVTRRIIGNIQEDKQLTICY